MDNIALWSTIASSCLVPFCSLLGVVCKIIYNRLDAKKYSKVKMSLGNFSDKMEKVNESVKPEIKNLVEGIVLEAMEKFTGGNSRTEDKVES